ncbi:MAG: hypothetical protein ACOYVG_11165 [Bacteroidota bacterium]
MKKLFFILFLFVAAQANTQSSQSNKSYLMPQLGIMDGDQSTNMQFQVVGGIVTGNWRIGAGMGLDYYSVRSVPVFVDIRNYFGSKKKAFVFANVGYNVPWPKEDQYKTLFIQGAAKKSEFMMALYTDMGIGYDIDLGKQKNLSVSIGYTIKKFSEKYDDRLAWIWRWPPPLPGSGQSERTDEYTYRRLSLKAGFRLW